MPRSEERKNSSDAPSTASSDVLSLDGLLERVTARLKQRAAIARGSAEIQRTNVEAWTVHYLKHATVEVGYYDLETIAALLSALKAQGEAGRELDGSSPKLDPDHAP